MLCGQYKEGPVYGTDISRALQKAGFKGLVFICSANDDCNSIKHYLAAGATGSLNKFNNITQELVTEIIWQCIIGFKASTMASSKSATSRLASDQAAASAKLNQPQQTYLGRGAPEIFELESASGHTDDLSVLVDELHCAGDTISS